MNADQLLAKLKKDPLWIVLILTVMYLLYAGSSAVSQQAVYTSCDNTEVLALEYWENWIEQNNGTGTDMGSLVIQNNVTYIGQWVVYDAPFGQTFVTSIDAIPCSQSLNYINEEDNTSVFTMLENRRILMYQNEYLWCNKADNVIFKALSIEVFSGYVNAFQKCEEITVPDYWKLNLNTNQCEAQYGTIPETNPNTWNNIYNSEKACEKFESGKFYINQYETCTPLNKDINLWPQDYEDNPTQYANSDCTSVIKDQCTPGETGWVECHETACKRDGTWSTVPGNPCPTCSGSWTEGECVTGAENLLKGNNITYMILIGLAVTYIMFKKEKKKGKKK